MGSLATATPTYLDGFINVSFCFPGGSSDGRNSAGTYDDRGQNCIDALRDVCLFAMNSKADAGGHTISQILAATVLTDNIGLYGASNASSQSPFSGELWKENGNCARTQPRRPRP